MSGHVGSQTYLVQQTLLFFQGMVRNHTMPDGTFKWPYLRAMQTLKTEKGRD